MQKFENIKASKLAKKVEGNLYGSDVELCGNYTFLNEANPGDIVIRHRIDEKGIEIAKSKKVSCIITQHPQKTVLDFAKKLDFPLITTDRIELATAYAIESSVNKYAYNSFRIAVTGTNGKSTTTHLLHTIFSDLGYTTYTNTDAESEGNTLIDPRVAYEISNFYDKHHKIDAITLEVSEVQGWFDRLMKNHAYYMISSLQTDVVIITNASLDHIGLVKSFEEIKSEIAGAARALKNTTKKAALILNYEDENIKILENIVKDNPYVSTKFFGKYDPNNLLDVSYKEGVGIYFGDKLYVNESQFPFTSWHFIQDIMAALCVCNFKLLNQKQVIESLKNYTPLARRFIKLNDNPVIIDDFAHNPSGIKLTINNGSKLGNHLFVVNAIRGSRGEVLNEEIAKALSEVLSEYDNYSLILTTSDDVVDHLNTVTEEESKIFKKVLDTNNINYKLYDSLEKSLLYTVKNSKKDDVILLLGAQGMDPARDILNKHNII